jgi:hypothetical protein
MAQRGSVLVVDADRHDLRDRRRRPRGPERDPRRAGPQRRDRRPLGRDPLREDGDEVAVRECVAAAANISRLAAPPPSWERRTGIARTRSSTRRSTGTRHRKSPARKRGGRARACSSTIGSDRAPKWLAHHSCGPLVATLAGSQHLDGSEQPSRRPARDLLHGAGAPLRGHRLRLQQDRVQAAGIQLGGRNRASEHVGDGPQHRQEQHHHRPGEAPADTQLRAPGGEVDQPGGPHGEEGDPGQQGYPGAHGRAVPAVGVPDRPQTVFAHAAAVTAAATCHTPCHCHAEVGRHAGEAVRPSR